jgi:hypothetical protein
MDIKRLNPEEFETNKTFSTTPSKYGSELSEQDLLERADLEPEDKVWIVELREKVGDLQFQLAMVKSRAAAIGTQSSRLGRSTATWADKSARAQLGSYPWAKLGAAFVGTFVATLFIRTLPLKPLASVAVPFVLRQLQAAPTRSKKGL